MQLSIKEVVTARELLVNTTPLTAFDDIMIPKLVERIEAGRKNEITVVFRGGVSAVAAFAVLDFWVVNVVYYMVREFTNNSFHSSIVRRYTYEYYRCYHFDA